MQKTAITLLIVLLCSCAYAGSGHSVVFNDTLTVEDGQMLHSASTFNYGGSATGNSGADTNRAVLIRIISRDTIRNHMGRAMKVDSCTLAMVCLGAPLVLDNIPYVWKVLVDWQEGTLTGSSSTSAVGYNAVKYKNSEGADVNWNTVMARGSGTDRATTAMDSLTVSAGSDGATYTFHIDTATAQGWITGAADASKGVRIGQPGTTSSSSAQQDSWGMSENTTAANRPIWTIYYEVPRKCKTRLDGAGNCRARLNGGGLVGMRI